MISNQKGVPVTILSGDPASGWVYAQHPDETARPYLLAELKADKGMEEISEALEKCPPPLLGLKTA